MTLCAVSGYVTSDRHSACESTALYSLTEIVVIVDPSPPVSSPPKAVSPAPKAVSLMSKAARDVLSSTRWRTAASSFTCAFRWSAFGAVALAFGACTLTAEEFEPQIVTGEAQPEPEVPGLCGAESECCAASPCREGQVCRQGVCDEVEREADAGSPPCRGLDCPSPPTPPLIEPSCDDGVANGDETGVDCGGDCPLRCDVGQGCRSEADCVTGAFCPPGGGVCVPPACTDGVRNGNEREADCGGGVCEGCPSGAECEVGADCASAVCGADSRCAAPACDDGVRNGDELGLDCGGECAARCPTGTPCSDDAECESGVCAASFACGPSGPCCQAPACDDGVANGGEPVVDCGNASCGLCGLGERCGSDAHCASGFCSGGFCADPGRCDDGVQNGRESSPDCGGDRCPVCPDLRTCNQDSDCFNRNCDDRGICISCGDATINGTETDIDCGGSDPACQRCIPGQRCLVGGDCASGFCFNGFC